MSPRRLRRMLVAASFAAVPAFADTFTETFEGGSNTGGWLFGGPGETIEALGPSSPPAPDWNALITDVDELRFFYGNPEDLFIFQVWNVGLDNVSVVADVVPVELLGLTVE